MKFLKAISYSPRSSESGAGKLTAVRRGQAMMLSVVLLSTAILGTTALVGILMIYEIRYTGDVVSSAQAVFAADAGIECALYNHYQSIPPDNPTACGTLLAPVEFDNGATFRVDLIPVGVAGFRAESFGRSRSVSRAFSVEF